MAIDTTKEIDASFFSRYMTAGKIKKLLSALDDSYFIVPNHVGNLSIYDKDGKMIGYIDFHEEDLCFTTWEK